MVEIQDVGDPNALVPQRIEIEMTDGAIHAVDMAEVIGSPAKPLSGNNIWRSSVRIERAQLPLRRSR